MDGRRKVWRGSKADELIPECNHTAITFDIDWAPDWCIEKCISLCRKHDAKATFFVTHPTCLLNELLSDPLFEVGIHPNFLSGSSQGSDPLSVLEFCMNLVPDAASMRTHSLHQSTEIFRLIAETFPSISTDVSLLLPLHAHLMPTDLYFAGGHNRITRLPYFWEDDVFAEWPGWEWDQPPPECPGLKIFDFHPVYVALNIKDMDGYRTIKERLYPRKLHEADYEDFFPFLNGSEGACTFLERVLGKYGRGCSSTVSEMTQCYRGAINA